MWIVAYLVARLSSPAEPWAVTINSELVSLMRREVFMQFLKQYISVNPLKRAWLRCLLKTRNPCCEYKNSQKKKY